MPRKPIKFYIWHGKFFVVRYYMFHGFSYPDENPDHNLISRFWTPIMEDGVIRFESPDSPLLDRHIVRHGLNVKEFNLGKNVTSAEEE